MKVKSLFICLGLGALLGIAPLAKADVGLGIVIGSPTGFSGKFGLDKAHAIDGALAWELGPSHLHIHSDYLWLKNAGVHLDNVALDWYFGIGGRLVFFNTKKHDDDYRIGVRGPIGIGYTFRDPRIEVFGELALIMNILESTSVDIDGGIGARFHF